MNSTIVEEMFFTAF